MRRVEGFVGRRRVEGELGHSFYEVQEGVMGDVQHDNIAIQ